MYGRGGGDRRRARFKGGGVRGIGGSGGGGGMPIMEIRRTGQDEPCQFGYYSIVYRYATVLKLTRIARIHCCSLLYSTGYTG